VPAQHDRGIANVHVVNAVVDQQLGHRGQTLFIVPGGTPGLEMVLGTFEQTRPMVAAQALGIARAALEYVTEYANRREAFGGPIIGNQGIAFPLADLATRIDAASETAVATAERAIQTMGGWGYITDHPVEKWYRDAKWYTIFEGTSEIQRIVVSHALGAADGAPPMHVDLEPTGGPLNAFFGRGTPARTRVADRAMHWRDRVPRPAMQLAMKVLRPPRK
jgi:acyl-CoA dehydrogenase